MKRIAVVGGGISGLATAYEIDKRLRAAGADVFEAVVYKNVKPKGLPRRFTDVFEAGKIDLVTFTSSSTVRNFVDLVGHLGTEQGILAGCIGPITADTAREAGFDVAVEAEAEEISVIGLAEAIRAYYAEKKDG